MRKYIERMQAPVKNDKHWLHTSAGGVNRCIEIEGGSVLPNCTGYAWGRWYELLGKKPKLSTANAEAWWGKADGYERGQVPKLGAVICWSKGVVGVGKDGAGHVAIVEQINADGSIVTSNSGYGGSRWYKKTIKPPYTLKDYDFQGFIYLPMTFDEEGKQELTYRVYAGGQWGQEVRKECVLPMESVENIHIDLKGGAFDCIAIRAEGFKIRYRVRIKGGNWLPWVDGYDITESKNGFAGICGKAIDAVQIDVME